MLTHLLIGLLSTVPLPKGLVAGDASPTPPSPPPPPPSPPGNPPSPPPVERVSSSFSWQLSTTALETIPAGATTITVADCARAAPDRQLRLGGGTGREEEAHVARVLCPSPGLAASSQAAAAAAAECADPSAPCDPRAANAEALRAAPRPPRKQAAYSELAALQPADGAAAASTTAATEPMVGVLVLSYGTLFAHPKGEALLGYPAADPARSVKHCAPGCAAHGTCNSFTGECACNAGWNGTSCEWRLCEPACGAHGRCDNGTCACDAGWAPPTCEALACPSGCSGHGRCLPDGQCACDEGWAAKADCSQQGDGCPDGCSAHGRCVDGTCHCRAGWVGVACGDRIDDCPASCNHNGLCDKGACACYRGYSGLACDAFCPHNCSERGRCTQFHQCVCATGYGGPDCSVVCPNRCSAHGECVDGECVCLEGFGGEDCSRVDAQTLRSMLASGLRAQLPLALAVVVAVAVVVVAFLWAYLRNLCDGKSGTDAIPLYDYMIETWSGAGVYEPTWVKTQVVPPPRFAGDA